MKNKINYKKIFFVLTTIVFATVFFVFPQQAKAIDGWTAQTNSSIHTWRSIASSSDGTELIATAGYGYIYVSTDSGKTWEEKIGSGLHSWGAVASSSDGEKLVATVTNGYIYTSVDGGEIWTEQTSAGSRQWSSVASSSDGEKLVATVTNGYIYTSVDGGEIWTEQTSAGSHQWSSVASSFDSTKLVASVNYGGYIYTSVDGGEIWTEQTSAGSRSWDSVASSSDGEKLVAVDFNGYIYTSVDGGEIWTEQTNAGSHQWYSVASSADGMKLVAVVLGGYIYTSVDGGEIWTEQTNAGSHQWYSVASSADGTKLAALPSNGYIYTYGVITAPVVYNLPASIVDQNTFILNAYINTDHDIHGFEYGLTEDYSFTITETDSFGLGIFSATISSLSPNAKYHFRAFATNEEGTSYGPDSIFETSIFEWTEQTSAGQRYWNSIDSSSDGSKLIASVGDSWTQGYLYTSTDAGASWVERTSSGSRAWYSVSSSLDGTKLMAVHYGGYVYTSIDGGENWVAKTSAPSTWWMPADSSGDGTMLAVGRYYNGYIYTSIDEGENWLGRGTTGLKNWRSIVLSSDGTKLVAAASNYINEYLYSSDDFGESWNILAEAGSRYWSSIASSSDGTKLVATAINGYIYISIDGGENWVEKTGAGYRNWRSVSISSDGTKLVAVDYGGYIYISLDGGENWIEQTNAGSRYWRSVSVSPDGIKIVALTDHELDENDQWIGGFIYTHSFPIVPILTTEPATSITTSTATLNGSITDIGLDNPTVRGFEYGLTGYENRIEESGVFDVSPYTLNILNLTCGSTYNFRSYATNTEGTGYSENQTFTTGECENTPRPPHRRRSRSSGSSSVIISKFYQEQEQRAIEAGLIADPNQPPQEDEACLPGYIYSPITGIPCLHEEPLLFQEPTQKEEIDEIEEPIIPEVEEEIIPEVIPKEELTTPSNNEEVNNNQSQTQQEEKNKKISNNSNSTVLGIFIKKNIEGLVLGVQTTGTYIAKSLNTKGGKISSKIISSLGVATGVYASFVTAIVLSPITFSEIPIVFTRLWGLLLSSLRIKKKNKPWGTVYDSVTKQPLDPAYVILEDLNGKEISTCITDLDGRYGFLVPAGTYRIKANKTNYQFPSTKLQGKQEDEIYNNLYFSELITITEGEVITKNIPMDPLKFDWNEFTKNKQHLMKFFSRREIWVARISNLLFIAGFLFSTLATFITPSTLNTIVFIIYMILILFKGTILKSRPYGSVKYKNNDPLSFAILRIFDKDKTEEVTKKISTKTGRYYCLIPNGIYSLKIENKNPDETYTEVYVEDSFEVKKGYINERFEI